MWERIDAEQKHYNVLAEEPFQNFARNFNGDYFETIKILTHPFLSGASEEAIIEKMGGSWEECFVKASSKVAFLDSYIGQVELND